VQDIFITIARVPSIERLETLERNIRDRNAGSAEIEAAIEAKYAEFGRDIIAAKTGLDLADLSPAEQRIVDATGRLVGLMKRDGKSASRTFQILRNRGLIEAAEVTVARSKVTEGFNILQEAGLKALTFEQIIDDYPDEFSARAQWYARRTLRLPNDSKKPPADLGTLTQQRTEQVLDWLAGRAAKNGGLLSGFTNAEIGTMLGFDDLARHGRVQGNIQSRLDFACYRAGVPPLGLCVIEYFANAWSQEGRSWRFPVSTMRQAAQDFQWSPSIFDVIRANARLLPGQAAIPWRQELSDREANVRKWAEGLKEAEVVASPPVAALLSGEDLAEIERKLLNRRPEVIERISKTIERGSVGAQLKRANGFRCQICDALGNDAVGFIKRDGEPYVEAHHATPVSAMEIGSLSATNIMILCANHHRQMHYGNVSIQRTQTEFILMLAGHRITIQRFGQNDG
jgi:hypothetical protein